MDRNSEGYPDPTAGEAYENIMKAERAEEYAREGERLAAITKLIPIIKQTAELVGFEVIERIALKDKATGKEYR